MVIYSFLLLSIISRYFLIILFANSFLDIILGFLNYSLTHAKSEFLFTKLTPYFLIIFIFLERMVAHQSIIGLIIIVENLFYMVFNHFPANELHGLLVPDDDKALILSRLVLGLSPAGSRCF